MQIIGEGEATGAIRDREEQMVRGGPRRSRADLANMQNRLQARERVRG